MATLTKAINKNLFDSILPSFGNPRVHIPVWDDSQKMFICDEYESGNGHRYYRGIRFCDRIVILEKVGLYHSWTYIDSIELYAFNGQVKDYLTGVMKTQRISVPTEQIALQAQDLISGCYKSFLDPDFNTRLTQILPKLEQH